jgi:ComF family protein
MSLVDILFPKSCLSCKKSGKYLCVRCVKKVPLPKLICPACDKASIDGMTHHNCLTPWGLDGIASLWRYQGIVRLAITSLKYKYATEIAKDLNPYIKQRALKVILPKESILVPVPLSQRRKNWRGFNQVEEIGKRVAVELGYKFAPHLIQRMPARPQTGLEREARLKNVKGIFRLNPKYKSLKNINKTFLIIDDVYTTGATLKEIGKVLKRKGAKKVWGLTIAH